MLIVFVRDLKSAHFFQPVGLQMFLHMEENK